MDDKQFVEHREALLATYRRSLTHLLKQAAHYGGETHAPLHITNMIYEVRQEIHGIKTTLRSYGVDISDDPIEEPTPEREAIGGFKKDSIYNERTIDSIIIIFTMAIPVILAYVLDIKRIWNSANPALLLVAYWLFLITIWVFTKIIRRLGGYWIDKATKELDTVTRGFFLKFSDQYLKNIIYLNRFIDVKGLTTQGPYSLMLDQVFVELGLVPQPIYKMSVSPFAVPKDLREGQHSIWDYLTSKQMKDANLVIIGPPGSGKTTLLKNITLSLADRKLRQVEVRYINKTPILLFLRDISKMVVENPDKDIDQIVFERMKSQDLSVSRYWIKRKLSRGKCIIMLDGLDEVGGINNRERVTQWVRKQMEKYVRNRFIITSRPFGYRDNTIDGIVLLEVRPFNHNQVQRFIHNWYLSNEIMSSQKDDFGVRITARQNADDLIKRIYTSPALIDLSVNPLLLTMIANVHRYRSTLPGRRVELYSEIFQVFLGKRQQAKGLDIDLSPSQQQNILQVLAYHMMAKEKRTIDTEDILAIIKEPLALVGAKMSENEFLQMIEQKSGLLIERENGIYSFSHLTFQEYLASVYIQEKRLENDLLKHVSLSWWHETIRLYVAQADATTIISACLSEGDSSPETLVLAIECLEESYEMDPKLRYELETVISNSMNEEHFYKNIAVAEALLILRIKRMVPIDENVFVDNGLISQSDYRIFLEYQYRDKGKMRNMDTLNKNKIKYKGSDPMIGLQPSDSLNFISWVNQRFGTNWLYQLPDRPDIDIIINDEKRPSREKIIPSYGYWYKYKDDILCSSSKTFNLLRIKNMLFSRISQDIEYDNYCIIAQGLGKNIKTFITILNRYLNDEKLSLSAYSLVEKFIVGEYFSLEYMNRCLIEGNHSMIYQLITNNDPELENDKYYNATSSFGAAQAQRFSLSVNSAIAQILGKEDFDTKNIDNNINFYIDNQSGTNTQWMSLVRWYLRYCALMMALIVQKEIAKPKNENYLLAIGFSIDDVEKTFNNYTNMYISLFILEERENGVLHPFEGLKLVKSRK